jgi:hydrogenase maturation protein HypF
MKSDKNTHRLALGADLKNAVALHVGEDIIEFPYCGDLLNGPILHAQSKNVSDFLDLFHAPVHELEASAIDFHPETFTQELTMTRQTAVPHHLAHAWSASHECPSDMVLTFDGTGYDENLELGGGDGFVLSEKTWHRCLQLKPVKFVGGSSSVTDPWKSLVLFFSSIGMSLETLRTCFSDLPNSKIPHETLDVFYTYALRSPGVLTTSMGRWFDAAAALIEFGGRVQTYEAQAPLRLEHLAKPFQYNFDIAQYIIQSLQNEKPLVEVNAPAMLLELYALKKNHKISVEHLAFVTHDMMAQAIAHACHLLGFKTVTGTGGVFQNELFSQLLKKHLHSMQIQFSRPTKNPVNDQSIALGQLFYLENANA